MSNPQDLTPWERSQDLYLFTSLTSGSSHIFTATSRLETILKANKIPFRAIDLATDESARRLWQRRGGKRKLPGLVKEGFVVGGIDEIEELNEFGELREAVGLGKGVAGGITAGMAGPGPAAGLGGGLGHIPGTAPPPNTKVATPVAGVQEVKQDPMKDLAAQAASIGLEKQKGPKALVGADKIRPLPKASTVGSTTDAAKSSSVEETKSLAATADKTEPPTLPEETIKASDPVTGEAIKTTSILSDSTKPETMASSTNTKQASLDTATATASSAPEDRPTTPSKATPSVSTTAGTAIPSALTSTDSLAPAPTRSTDSLASVGSTSTATKHRGSEVVSASQEEIKQIEAGNKITETEAEEEEGLQKGESKEPVKETTVTPVAKELEDKTSEASGEEKSIFPSKADAPSAKPSDEVVTDKEEEEVKRDKKPGEEVEAKESKRVESETVKKAADGDAAGVSVED
ncbi:hypothetical protein KVT40_002615 [Elsinoe batatas]|uniref:Glutaredoxin domain-containing protein n=1 Tax=Elsinoe batatas TaxID=2601811 RepID=A0A8K0L773_9PEZI|nr:hypothetical protein KVT40_002615 [Elsinoe batatas]